MQREGIASRDPEHGIIRAAVAMTVFKNKLRFADTSNSTDVYYSMAAHVLAQIM